VRQLKTFVVLVAAGLAVAAFAQYTSPELLFVTDYGGTTPLGATVPAQIERYDPYTGAYLGAFGAGYVSDPTGIAIQGSEAYVTDPFSYGGTYFTRIDKFNFSTGAYDGSIMDSSAYNLFGLSDYGSNLLACDYGDPSVGNDGVYTFNSAGSQTGFWALPAGSEAESIAADGSHSYIATAGGPGLMSYNLDANGLTTGLNFTAGAGNVYFGAAAFAAKGSAYAAGLNSSAVGVIDEFSTSGVLLSEYTNGSQGFDSLAFGHNGIMYAFDALNDQILRFDGTVPLNFGPLGSFALNDTADGRRMAVYAAPEPVSMLTLGLGIAGLALRKRRRSRSH